jgi:hypothetical protein
MTCLCFVTLAVTHWKSEEVVEKECDVEVLAAAEDNVAVVVAASAAE